MQPLTQPDTRDERIGSILNDFLDRKARGQAASEQELLDQHPEYVNELREHLALLRELPGTNPLLNAADSLLSDSLPGYKIIHEIHRGGQGVIYEAIQLSTGRIVAVKVMLEGPYAGERSKWRFEREVKLIAALRHPNIVVIHDSGITHGKYYFAMDYIQGRPLDGYIKTRQSPVRETIRLFSQVCEAISYAHRRGVIHRDLKPSNILVRDDGTPCVLDFGLAKLVGDDWPESRPEMATLSGQVMGTLHYMAPEQTKGDPNAIDTRTDVYSLGLILYELLTGAMAYPTDDADLAAAFRNIRDTDPPRPSHLRGEMNSEIDAMVLKAMAKEPDRRYQSAGELAEDLNAWLAGRPVTAKSNSSLYVLRKLAVKHGFETAVIGALLVSIISFGIISFEFYREARNALAKQVESQRHSADVDKQYDDGKPAIKTALARQSLGWFLAEWSNGRLDSARRIQEGVARNDPEYAAAMSFLLNRDYSVEQLRQTLPADAGTLLHFVVGERALANGRTDEAVRSFESCMEFTGDDWIKSAAKARLEQISSRKIKTGEKPGGNLR